jgi:hypothetical protein
VKAPWKRPTQRRPQGHYTRALFKLPKSLRLQLRRIELGPSGRPEIGLWDAARLTIRVMRVYLVLAALGSLGNCSQNTSERPPSQPAPALTQTERKPAEPKRPPRPPTARCELLRLSDTSWLSRGLVERGTSLRSSNEMMAPALETSEHFVMAVFEYENIAKVPKTAIHPFLVDSEDRRYAPLDREGLYLGRGVPQMDERPLNPSIGRIAASIYEVPKNAKNLRLVVASADAEDREYAALELGEGGEMPKAIDCKTSAGKDPQ